MHTQEHWEDVYNTKETNQVSWFQEHAETSLTFIDNAVKAKDAAIIDVGGGASTLVDDLLLRSHNNVTVLDLSLAALQKSQSRIGEKSASVQWLQGNILETSLRPNHYDVWHDRAVFHFLTSPLERQTYISKLCSAVKKGALVVIATFAEDGPEKCSGLPVMRYSADELQKQFGAAFELLASKKESHFTPWGSEQRFTYCSFIKRR